MNDLTIPDFLRATGPGGTPQLKATTHSDERERPYPLTDADRAAIAELTNANARRDEVKEYEAQKRFAEFEQRRLENPDLVRMERKAKRDKERRIAKLGIKATGRRRRGR